MRTLFVALPALALFSGCAITQSLSYKSAYIGSETRKLGPAFEGKAAIYMDKQAEELVVSQRPSSFAGKGVVSRIPLNSYVKEVFSAAFEQMCSGGATATNSISNDPPYHLLIKPVVESFDYKMSLPFSLDAGQGFHVFVKLRVHVTVEQAGGKKLLDRSFGGETYVEYGKEKIGMEREPVNKAVTLEILNCAVAVAREVKEAIATAGGN